MRMSPEEARTRKQHYEKKYRDENRERAREADKKYYQKNKDRIIQEKRDYRVKNKEAVLLQKKDHYTRNKARIRLYNLKRYYGKDRTKPATDARVKKALLLTLQELKAGEITPEECEAFISSAGGILHNKRR